MIRRHALTSLAAAGLSLPIAVAHATGLDDGDTGMTVMQFTAKDSKTLPELRKRMLAMRDFQRQRPGHIDNGVFENRNPQGKPQLVAVARWKTIKDREGLWQDQTFKRLVAGITEMGELNPGVCGAVK